MFYGKSKTSWFSWNPLSTITEESEEDKSNVSKNLHLEARGTQEEYDSEGNTYISGREYREPGTFDTSDYSREEDDDDSSYYQRSYSLRGSYSLRESELDDADEEEYDDKVNYMPKSEIRDRSERSNWESLEYSEHEKMREFSESTRMREPDGMRVSMLGLSQQDSMTVYSDQTAMPGSPEQMQMLGLSERTTEYYQYLENMEARYLPDPNYVPDSDDQAVYDGSVDGAGENKEEIESQYGTKCKCMPIANLYANLGEIIHRLRATENDSIQQLVAKATILESNANRYRTFAREHIDTSTRGINNHDHNHDLWDENPKPITIDKW